MASALFRFTVCLGTAATAWYSLWLAPRLVTIEMDNRNLFVSNFQTRATVSLDAVADVTEGNWMPYHPVTIEFDRDTPFGRRVTFFPDMTDQWLRFAPHRVVEQLEAAVRMVRDSEGVRPRLPEGR